MCTDGHSKVGTSPSTPDTAPDTFTAAQEPIQQLSVHPHPPQQQQHSLLPAHPCIPSNFTLPAFSSPRPHLTFQDSEAQLKLWGSYHFIRVQRAYLYMRILPHSTRKVWRQTDRQGSLKQPLYSAVAEHSTGMFQGFASSDSNKTAEEVIILIPRLAQAANTQVQL